MNNVYEILNKNLDRSNQLGDWTSPDIFTYKYWEIRVYLPDKILEGVEQTINYICDEFNLINNFNQKDKFSFYFWLKDELEKVAKLERMELTPKIKSKNKIKSSPRAKEYSHLLELHELSGGNPVLAEEIKIMPYEVIFDMLLAKVINNETTINNMK